MNKSLSDYYKVLGISHCLEGHSQMDKGEADFLAHIARVNNVKSVLEIGFNAGHSCETFLEVSPETHVLSFDIGVHPYVQLGRNWIHCHYPKRHELVIGDSRITIPEYASANPGKTFDLVFIDGGHDYAIARADLKNCQELSNPKTIVVMDDVMSNQDWLSEWNVGPTKAWFEAVEDGAAIELGNVVFSRLFGLSYGRYLF